MRGVRGITEQIKFCGRMRVVTGKGNLFAAAPDIEGVTAAKLITFAIDGHTACAADIEYAQLAALCEVIRAQRGIRAEQESLRKRHGGAYRGAVQIDINEIDATGLKEMLDEKRRTQFGRTHSLRSYLIRQLQYLHGYLAFCFDCALLSVV